MYLNSSLFVINTAQIDYTSSLFPNNPNYEQHLNTPLYNVANSLTINMNNNNANVSKNTYLINQFHNYKFSPKLLKKQQRFHFTKEEDERLKYLVNIFGRKNWQIISSFMNERSAKQCRDRYCNYLIPGFFNGEWSKEEDELLIKLYNEIGSKWSVIQKYFPKRSSNSVKNRLHYFLRKMLLPDSSTDAIKEKEINEYEIDENENCNLLKESIMETENIFEMEREMPIDFNELKIFD